MVIADDSSLGSGGARRIRTHIEFQGTNRFTLLRRIGAGAMGVVYAAHDRQRDETIALKTLLEHSSSAVLRLKHEFRALADLTHPNLVVLYELISEADQWFFTMELVDGVDFFNYVRGNRLAIDRLRAVLSQLAGGLTALHAAGKLHRDLKPSNVLVTPDGRVVILDFGISGDQETEHGRKHSVDRGMVGTLAYMAPEQVEGRSDAASDQYALGVMLYQALTGELPYTGNAYQVLEGKRSRDPVRPDALVSGLPLDLADLAMDLLSRHPAQRPGNDDVLRRLGAAQRNTSAPIAVPRDTNAIIGREPDLAALENAFAATLEGRAVTVCIHGASGVGKSSLLHWFLRHRLTAAKAVILRGRCYERESMPYKALDGVLDDLSSFLRALPSKHQAAAITRDVAPLARLFPALEWIEASQHAAGWDGSWQEPVQLRRQAFAALRGLLRRLSVARPLVIHIDDLQWGDAESLLALDDLLREPEAPPILLALSFRSEEIAAKDFLRSLLVRARNDRSGRVREIELAPLTGTQTRDLVTRLLPAGSPDDQVEAIAAESQGVPFLAELLARHLSTMASRERATGVTVAEMIDAQLRELPEGSRNLLETITVAARPIDSIVARDATGLTGDERRLVRALQSAHLLRSGSSAAQIELYHDRIRETVARRIPPDRLAGIHLALAQTMESHGVDEPETLCEHYLEAGQVSLAGSYAERAGDKAVRSLAFERAASLYRRALDLQSDPAAKSSLQARLAEALGNAGRGVEAATVYLAAASGVSVDSVDMRRKAASHLLRCGYIERAFDVVSDLVDGVGVRLPRSHLHALTRVLVRRAQLWLRGYRFVERSVDRIHPAVLTRIDVCMTVAAGLARVDGLRAIGFHSLALLLALREGETRRVAQALGTEAAILAIAGGRATGRIERVLELTRTLGERNGDQRVLGFYYLVRGMAHNHRGEFALSHPHFETAEKIFREACVGAWGEIDVVQAHRLLSLYYTGEFRELAQRVRTRLQEAKDHDDVYAIADALGRPNVLWLAADDPTSARQTLEGIRRPVTLQGMDWPDYLRLFAETQIDLYVGDAARAWERVTSAWPRLKTSTIMRIQSTRLEAFHLRARCALAAAQTAHDPSFFLRIAARDARRIAREQMPWGLALVDLLRAGIAFATGERATAATYADRAASGFQALGFKAYAAAAATRRAAGVPADAPEELRRKAADWMADQQIVNPERFARMLAP